MRVADTDRRDLDEHVALARDVGRLLPILSEVGDRVTAALDAGGRVYTFGNGGSAADAQHFAAELVGRYKRDRRPLPAVALSVDPSVMTCIANDYAFEEVFTRQVEALVGPRDVVIAFSTTGRSPNIINGLAAARQVRATTVLFTGGDGGAARQQADLALVVPSTTTARVQEMHLLLLHLLSERVDAWAADEDPGREIEPGTDEELDERRGIST
jgi:D-sedoheptulose 7-phosphate isomerase